MQPSRRTLFTVTPLLLAACLGERGGTLEPEAAEFCNFDLPTEGGERLERAVDQIAVGDHFSCARAGGDVFCWGANNHGHLGDGTLISRARPVQVNLDGVVDLASGSGADFCFSQKASDDGQGTRGSNTCAARTDGHVDCWGTNIGFDTTLGASHAASMPTPVGELVGVTQLSVNGWRGCARISDGTARCWGHRDALLGDGVGDPMETVGLVTVKGLDNVRQVVAGERHACAVHMDGTVSCWGHGVQGQIGDGSSTLHPAPARVSGVADVVMIATRTNTTCAAHRDGTVSCWGYGLDGKGVLGATSTSQLLPVVVENLDAVVQLAVAASYACAALADGGVACWGQDQFAPIGALPPAAHPPARIAGLAAIVEVQTAADHACARDQSGHVFCWGSNFAGQLGDGTTVRRDRPVRVE